MKLSAAQLFYRINNPSLFPLHYAGCLEHRAYSGLTIKSVDDAQRVITGIATTIEADRDGDVVEPKGAEFKLPLALLWQHDARQPIGQVFAAKVTTSGIEIKARIAKIDEPGTLKNRIDEAWHSIKSGLVAGLSIGFKPKESARIEGSFGHRFTKWIWLELSAVTIPANAGAAILSVKALDTQARAAIGIRARVPISHPGDSGASKDTTMNVSEQITAAKADLQTKSTRLEELLLASGNEGGLEAAEQTELETLTKGVADVTTKIGQLSALEAAQALNAKAVTIQAHAGQPAQHRPKVEVKKLDKGILFTRVAMALAAGRGSISDSIEYAKRFSGTPEVLKFIREGWYQKAEAGTSVVESPGWGGELVNPNTMMTEFVELLRAETIIGKVDGFRRVPFNIPIITQTGGSTFNWVGEGAPKPVGELAFERTTLGYSKVAGIVVLTDELVRLSIPSAEQTVRDSMVADCARFLDQQFIQVGISSGASNPASITNGEASPSASGTTAAALRHDLNIALKVFTDAGVSTSGLVIVMTSALARGISLLTTTLGVAEFPGMTPEGGTLLGYKVIVSDSVDSGTIVVFQPREVFLADDGRVTLDASREATLDMSGSTTATFSLWQNNCVGIRAEQWIRWQKRREAGVVAIIDTAAYAPA